MTDGVEPTNNLVVCHACVNAPRKVLRIAAVFAADAQLARRLGLADPGDKADKPSDTSLSVASLRHPLSRPLLELTMVMRIVP